MASLAVSLTTLAVTIGEQFADAQSRAARSSADLDAVVTRMMTIPERIRRKHGLA